MKQTLISVIIPTFNRAHIITQSLKSVYKQSWRPIDLIVVDDGSQDDTENVVKNWINKHSDKSFNIRYIKQNNSGGNVARNRGIQEAKGEFVAFLDSDDLWMQEKLEKQITVFDKEPEIGAVYCGLRDYKIDTSVRSYWEKRSFATGWLLKQLLVHDVTTTTSCFMIKKECFDACSSFDESLQARQDWDMWIRIALKYKIDCVPEVLVEYGQHTGERTISNPYKELNAHKAIFKKYRHLRQQFPFWITLQALASMYRRRGRVYHHQKISHITALYYLVLAVLIWPFHFDSYAALGGALLPKGFRQALHVHWNQIFGRTVLAIKSH